MNEVIQSIMDAEQRAEELIGAAAEESRKIAQDAANEEERIRKNSVAALAQERDQALAQANERAEKSYTAILQEQSERAKDLKREAEKNIDKAADTIVGRLFG